MSKPQRFKTKTGHQFLAYPWTVGDTLALQRVRDQEELFGVMLSLIDRKVLLGQSDYDVSDIKELPMSEFNAILEALVGKP